MPSVIVCHQCGESIEVDYKIEDPTQREPCPKCGSISRVYSVSATATLSLHASGIGEVITYPRILIDNARRLCVEGQSNIAVVVAHMACEVAVERKLAETFAKHGVSHLQESIYDLLNGFNIGNDKLRKLYVALSGDQINQQAFWQSFMESVTRRNRIIHKGLIVTQTEAEESLKAADGLVTHLGM